MDGVSQLCLIPGRSTIRCALATHQPESPDLWQLLGLSPGVGGSSPLLLGAVLGSHQGWRLQDEMEFGFWLLSLCEMKAKACSNMTQEWVLFVATPAFHRAGKNQTFTLSFRRPGENTQPCRPERKPGASVQLDIGRFECSLQAQLKLFSGKKLIIFPLIVSVNSKAVGAGIIYFCYL